MKISVKCPNCYQQVSKDNRFCIFCGYDLEGVPSDSSDEKPVPVVSDPVTPDPVPYTGPCFCPKGHDVPDPSLGFCPTCGSPLIDEPSAEESSAEAPFVFESPTDTEVRELPQEDPKPAVFTSRKCRCGYICDDPKLNFCPACGIPFDSYSETPVADAWTCSCGKENPAEMAFCSECGAPKGSKPYPEKTVEAPVPDGMKPPTDDDLLRKS